MNNFVSRMILLMAAYMALFMGTAHATLESDFTRPPDAARPWVFWFWNNGNMTREGITADLESMQRVGIGGVLIMEVSMGAPLGPIPFMGPQWRELFKHVISEAARLGLEVNMNNDAGWNGSGGPWITPEKSMQKLIWSELSVHGSVHFDALLEHPTKGQGYYRDVAVFAFPEPQNKYRVKNIAAFAGYEWPPFSALQVTTQPLAAEQVIDKNRIVNLSAKMAADGRLQWDVPAGQWTIMRFGHTSGGNGNAPSPASGAGLECDKLCKEGIEAHFDGMIRKLIADNVAEVGKAFVSTHIDSWEVGPQNWTARMPEEFRKRRGYDPLPYLPIVAGCIVGNKEVSERFLWDFRQTISELMVENYTGHMRTLANQHGIRLSMEAYGGPFDELTCSGSIDEPICEFWIPGGYQPFLQSMKEMSSGAHIYGGNIVGAEAFTAMSDERWLQHPGSMKAFGDYAFCNGVNRFIFHRFAHSPWLDRKPGMSMGPYGTHYERTQTWWDQSTAWHTYLARCQYLLRQGQFVADVCYLQPEGAPQSLELRKGNGYDYDAISPELVLNKMSVKNGQLILPSGMIYRVLALSDVTSMTPVLLRRIKFLIESGATVIGNPPSVSLGLSNYPECDREIKKLANEIWGDCDGVSVTQRRLGEGRVMRGVAVDEALRRSGIPSDFTTDRDMNFIHRRMGETDIYFLSNATGQVLRASCTFRVSGKQPELWNAMDGSMKKVRYYTESNGLTSLPMRFEPSGSMFAVFRPKEGGAAARIMSINRNGQPLELLSNKPQDFLAGNLTMAFWAKPESEIDLPPEQTNGLTGTATKRNDAVFAQQGGLAFGKGHAGAGVSVGTNGICVYEHSDSYLPPVLVHPVKLEDWTHVAVVYAENRPTLYINGVPVREGPKSPMIVHNGIAANDKQFTGVFKGGFAGVHLLKRAMATGEIAGLMQSTREAVTNPERFGEAAAGLPEIDLEREEIWAPGQYEIGFNHGQAKKIDAASIPAPLPIEGPWNVTFPPNSGAPAQITLDRLGSLSDHSDSGVKHFSGTAVYTRTVNIPEAALRPNCRMYLDLGTVEVIASVKLNGQSIGTAWTSPHRIEITGMIHSGDNTLEIQVANRWINRMIGDEFLPEDSSRTDDGNIKEWPQWLQEGKPSPAGRISFTTWRLWKKDEALPASGLLGPVRLLYSRTFKVE